MNNERRREVSTQERGGERKGHGSESSVLLIERPWASGTDQKAQKGKGKC